MFQKLEFYSIRIVDAEFNLRTLKTIFLQLWQFVVSGLENVSETWKVAYLNNSFDSTFIEEKLRCLVVNEIEKFTEALMVLNLNNWCYLEILDIENNYLIETISFCFRWTRECFFSGTLFDIWCCLEIEDIDNNY